jgi:hypothetical protein
MKIVKSWNTAKKVNSFTQPPKAEVLEAEALEAEARWLRLSKPTPFLKS